MDIEIKTKEVQINFDFEKMHMHIKSSINSPVLLLKIQEEVMSGIGKCYLDENFTKQDLEKNIQKLIKAHARKAAIESLIHNN